MEKILSISIAAYNVSNYIETTLSSLVRSDVLDFLDILVINDGSKDDTLSIIRRFEEQYSESVRIIDKRNGGWGSTVNVGMEKAIGKYFKLLDGDDWYYTENITEFVDLLKHTEADIVLSSYGMYDEGLDKIYAQKSYPLDEAREYSYEDIANDFDIQMHALTVKTEVIHASDIHIVDNCFYTDTQFVAEVCANADTCIYYNKPIYCYRIGRDGQSVSPSGLLKHMGDNIKVAEELINYRNQLNLSGNKKIAFEKKINYAYTMEYYSYCALSKSKRIKKAKALTSQIEKKDIIYYPTSAEVRLNMITGFTIAGFIHFIFELGRKIGKIFNVDLHQHVN